MLREGVSLPTTGRQYEIFYPLEKIVFNFRPVFTSRPENRDRVSNCSLECCGLVSMPPEAGLFLLGHLTYQCFRGKHKSGDRGGVLQRVPGHFRGVDYACFHQVDILAGGNVVTFVP
jgi:hypothetical protein